MSRLTKWGLLLALLAVASKSLGLVRGGLIAYFFGTRPELNAFVVAKIVPLLVLNVFLGGAVMGAFIPAFTRRLTREGEEEAWRYAVSIAVIITTCGVALTVAVFLGAPWLVDLFGPGLSSESHVLAMRLLRMVVLALPFFTAATVAAAVLNSHDEFKAPGMRPLVQNGSVVFILASCGAFLGIQALVIGFLLGSVVQLLIQLPPLLKLANGRIKTPQISRADLREFLATYLPIFATHLMLQSSLGMDRAFATLSSPMGAAAVEYSEAFIDISRTIIGSSLAVVIFPHLSRVAAAGEEDPVLVGRAFGIVALTTVPLMLAYLCFGESFVAVVLQRGSFGAAENALTSAALLGLAPATLLFSMIYVFDRLFISAGRVWTYAAVLTLGLGCNLATKLALRESCGITGVTVGTSVGALVSVIVGAMIFHRISKRSFVPAAVRDLISVASCFGLGFAVAVWLSRQVAAPAEVAPYAGLLWSVLAGGIGLLLMHFVRPPAYLLVLDHLRRGLRG